MPTVARCFLGWLNYQRVGVGMEVKGKSDLGQRLLYEGARERPEHVMFWKGTDINRFWMAPKTNRFCRTDCAENLKRTEVVRLARQVYTFTPKILLRQTADHPIATLDTKGVWIGRSVLAILPTEGASHNIRYFLGLLNSTYFEYMYNRLASEKGRVIAQVKFAKLKQLPVRMIDQDDESDRQFHDRMVVLVDQMLALHNSLAAVKTDHDKTALQRQLDATDKQIDQLVYQLYGLTDDEIRIVEEATV